MHTEFSLVSIIIAISTWCMILCWGISDVASFNTIAVADPGFDLRGGVENP